MLADGLIGELPQVSIRQAVDQGELPAPIGFVLGALASFHLSLPVACLGRSPCRVGLCPRLRDQLGTLGLD